LVEGKRSVVNLNNFRDFVASQIELPIAFERAKDDGSFNAVYGFTCIAPFQGSKNEHLIIGLSKKNRCWFRFTVAKELFHALRFAGDQNNDVLLTDTIAEAHSLMSDRLDKRLSVRDILHPEMFCYYAAIELMIPLYYREAIASSVNKDFSYYDLALFLRCPEFILREFFEKHLYSVSSESWEFYQKRKV